MIIERNETEVLASEVAVEEIELREEADIDWFPGDWVICRTT